VLNSSVLTFVGDRISAALGVATVYTGGVGFGSSGWVAYIIGSIPDDFHQGLGFTTDGRLCSTDINPITHHAQGGMPMDDGGRLCIDTAAPVAYWSHGLPFVASGRLALTP
jgi:hypothetical protein